MERHLRHLCTSSFTCTVRVLYISYTGGIQREARIGPCNYWQTLVRSGLCSTPSRPLGACRRLWGSALHVYSKFFFFLFLSQSCLLLTAHLFAGTWYRIYGTWKVRKLGYLTEVWYTFICYYLFIYYRSEMKPNDTCNVQNVHGPIFHI
jgi:hypothetical protein